MISEITMIHDLPGKGRRSYRYFLVAYGLSMIFLIVFWGWLYYKSIMEEGEMFRAAVAPAFVGLVMTTIVGALAVKCIREVARAIKRDGQQEP